MTTTAAIRRSAATLTLMLLTNLTGCVDVKAPEQINVGYGRPRPADVSQVPPTKDHAEARQKLAEAYDEIRYLRKKVADLEDDKRDLKRKLDRYED